MIRRVLIANRGEIARRVIRTCHAMGIETVAVYSDVDHDAPHVPEADASVAIGPAAATESYLKIPAVIDAATHGPAPTPCIPATGSSPRTPRSPSVRSGGLIFIGPPAR